MKWMLLTMVLAGCAGANGGDGKNGGNGADGKDGDTGPAGEQGEPGPAGASAAAYRWVDAVGEEVSPTPDLLYIDDDGYSWFIHQESGEYTVWPSSAMYYENNDCTGPAFLTPTTPMVPFVVLAEAEPRPIYVRPKGLPLYEVCTNSFTVGGAFCNVEVAPRCFDGLSLDEMIPDSPISVPASSWLGPLHRER